MEVIMPAGQATGPNRVYQEHCRDVLVRLAKEEGVILLPHKGDGIDVPFSMGGTTWTLDVVLQSSDGALVVAECKRWVAPVEQSDIAAFGYELHLLKGATNRPVSGHYFARTSYREGARKAAQGAEIRTYTLAQDQILPDFVVVLETVVRGVSRRIGRRRHGMAFSHAAVKINAQATYKLTRADGTTEEGPL